MSKRLLGIGDVYTYDYKQVHKTRNVGFGYYDPNKVSTTSSTDGYVLVDGVLSVVNEDGSNEPGPGPEPPTPSLPPYTIRLKFTKGLIPTFKKGTGVQVSSSPNVWDLTYENSNWESLLESQTNLLEVIEANTSNVTSMRKLFRMCNSLTTVPLFDTSSVSNMNNMFALCYVLSSVPLFDTSKVTNIESMFYGCRSLTSVPLFNTSKSTNMNNMFYHCYNVETGALALYQQASSQANPPSNHSGTFTDCGIDTQTGATELSQIPDDWK